MRKSAYTVKQAGKERGKMPRLRKLGVTRSIMLTGDRKEAAERLRQLVNSNFENEIAVSVNYDICLSKTDTSLLTVNK